MAVQAANAVYVAGIPTQCLVTHATKPTSTLDGVLAVQKACADLGPVVEVACGTQFMEIVELDATDVERFVHVQSFQEHQLMYA